MVSETEILVRKIRVGPCSERQKPICKKVLSHLDEFKLKKKVNLSED